MSNNTFTEKELLTDLLHTEKSITKDYASNCTEVACPQLRAMLIRNMTECSEDQFAVFEQMKNRNMYQTKQAPQQEVQQAKQSMQTLKGETWQ